MSTLARPSDAEVEETIDLPELPETPQGKAATLLRVAAQIEHALMAQYLYAGYSVDPTERPIVDVAVEEMSHLMTVQNLLRCISEQPHLLRQEDDADTPAAERLFPFDFRLEPLSHLSLAKYVVAESPATVPAGVDSAVMAHIVDLATGAAQEPVDRVGVLYALLGVVFGTPALLTELAASGDPWYVVVNELAAEAAVFYGCPEAVHLTDNAFDPLSVSKQGSDHDWDRSRTTTSIDEFRVHVVGSRREALAALRDIGLQGEGPSPVAGETAHFRRFYDLFIKFFDADGMGTGRPAGVKDVPAGSHIVLDPNGSGENVISHPTTIRWARLADVRYAILLGALERYLVAPADDRAFLRGWCFTEMFALSKLAELLRQLPRNGSTSQVAALPLTVPGWLSTGGQWSDLAAALEEGTTIAKVLLAQLAADSPQRGLLVLMLASDERKLQEATARKGGTTAFTRTDAVRDVLEWAAGAGDPGDSHFGDSPTLRGAGQGRFWNQQHDNFVQVEIFGTNVTTRPSGGDASMIAKLRDGSMPLDRPALDVNGAEFRLVEQWVADGCPDDPV